MKTSAAQQIRELPAAPEGRSLLDLQSGHTRALEMLRSYEEPYARNVELFLEKELGITNVRVLFENFTAWTPGEIAELNVVRTDGHQEALEHAFRALCGDREKFEVSKKLPASFTLRILQDEDILTPVATETASAAEITGQLTGVTSAIRELPGLTSITDEQDEDGKPLEPPPPRMPGLFTSGN